MAVYEIDLSVRTNLTVEVQASSADEAWELAGVLRDGNGLDAALPGRVTSQYVDEIDMVRRKPEPNADGDILKPEPGRCPRKAGELT